MTSMSYRACISAAYALVVGVLVALLSITCAGAQDRPIEVLQLKPTNETEIKAQGAKRINGARLSKEVSGNTLYWQFLKDAGTAKAGVMSARYYRDSRTVVTKGYDKKLYEGLWWIEGDTYCNEQRAISAGNRCYAVYDFKAAWFLCAQPSGDCDFVARLRPGNPEHY